MKKLLTLILACTMILSCPVSASAASAKYTKATKAYESWMKKNCSKPYSYAYYDIVDIDQNGIPELLLSNQYTHMIILRKRWFFWQRAISEEIFQMRKS